MQYLFTKIFFLVVIGVIYVLAQTILKGSRVISSPKQASSDTPQPNHPNSFPSPHITVSTKEPSEDGSGDSIGSSAELQSPSTSVSLPPSPRSTTDKFSPPITSIRRNHSDLVLQSLLNGDDFDGFLPSSSLPRVEENAELSSSDPPPTTSSKESNSRSGSLRLKSTSARANANNKNNKEPSVAMNLALHNLNQMSLKIQQMQQGKTCLVVCIYPVFYVLYVNYNV